MKVALTIAYFLIGILGFFVWTNYMEVKRLEGLIPSKPAPTPTGNTNTTTETSSTTEQTQKRESVTGGELWDTMRERLKGMKLDLTFENENK